MVILVSLSSLFSYVSNVSVGISNDAFTFGIAENYDDLRSYGFSSSIDTSSGWKSKISLSGITFRNNSQPSSGSRLDEIDVFVGKEFPLFFNHNNINFVTYITLLGGIYVVGDLGFESVQNRWHQMIGVREVNLPYCNQASVSLYPQFGLNSRFSFFEKIPYYSYSNIVVEVESDFQVAPLYRTSYAIGLSIGQLSSIENYFRVGAGFTQAFSQHHFPLLGITASSESGLYVDLKGRLGLLNINYRLYTHSSRAYGGVEIGIYNNVDGIDHYYFTNDILFSIGSELLEKNMYAISIRYAITPTLGIYTSNAFGSAILEYNHQTRQNTSKWHLGVDYELNIIKSSKLKQRN